MRKILVDLVFIGFGLFVLGMRDGFLKLGRMRLGFEVDLFDGFRSLRLVTGALILMFLFVNHLLEAGNGRLELLLLLLEFLQIFLLQADLVLQVVLAGGSLGLRTFKVLQSQASQLVFLLL